MTNDINAIILCMIALAGAIAPPVLHLMNESTRIEIERTNELLNLSADIAPLFCDVIPSITIDGDFGVLIYECPLSRTEVTWDFTNSSIDNVL